MDAVASPPAPQPLLAGSAAKPARPKPLLRGVSHEVTAVAGPFATALLLTQAHGARAAWAALVYGASLTTLFAVSALYHRPTWRPGARRVLRRLDHSAIFVLIAGTYTPPCLLLGGRAGGALLAVVWAGALLGVVRAVAWPDAPRRLSAALYVLLGWAVVPVLPQLARAVGPAGVALLAAGGAAYTVGAVVYATRRPDPLPRVFGYHEVFHALVVVAAGCHFALVLRVVRAMS